MLSICLEAFFDFWEPLGFPITLEALNQTTPYDLAVTVFSRWSTVDEIHNELMEHTKLEWSKAMQDLSRFCVQAILYKLNILLTPKYKSLFIPDNLT